MNETTEKKKLNALELIEKNKGQLEAALPAHMTAEKMMRIIASEFRNTPLLYDCTQISLVSCVMQASLLGLNIGGILGECFLIPYKNNKKGIVECQFQIGYKGMLALAYRSDRIMSVNAHCVYENDKFSYRYGSDAFLHHEPKMGDRGERVGVYAGAKMLGGDFNFVVLSESDIQKAKNFSKAFSLGIWEKHPDEMAMKTAVRRLFKYLPISIEMQKGIHLDEASDDGRQAEIIEAEFEGVIKNYDEEVIEKSKSDKVSDLL